MNQLAFWAMYDWKIDSYHPRERLSTIRPTSAPRRDFSNSGELTPSFKGMKRLSRVIAMWMGIRHSISTSHSPKQNCDISHGAPLVRSAIRSSNSRESTWMLFSSFPLGLRLVCSNVRIISMKYGSNLEWSRSVANVRLWESRFCDEKIPLWMAAITGNLVQTSEWQSMRQLWAVDSLSVWTKLRAPFSWNWNCVILFLISSA